MVKYITPGNDRTISSANVSDTSESFAFGVGNSSAHTDEGENYAEAFSFSVVADATTSSAYVGVEFEIDGDVSDVTGLEITSSGSWDFRTNAFGASSSLQMRHILFRSEDADKWPFYDENIGADEAELRIDDDLIRSRELAALSIGDYNDSGSYSNKLVYLPDQKMSSGDRFVVAAAVYTSTTALGPVSSKADVMGRGETFSGDGNEFLDFDSMQFTWLK